MAQTLFEKSWRNVQNKEVRKNKKKWEESLARIAALGFDRR